MTAGGKRGTDRSDNRRLASAQNLPQEELRALVLWMVEERVAAH